MSGWRRKAIALFPELADRLGRGSRPEELFADLLTLVENRHGSNEADVVDLLGRVHGFAEWCLRQGGGLWQAAGIGFYEDLFDEVADWSTIVPWLSPYVVAQLETTWVARYPDRTTELAALVSSRADHRYRNGAYWTGAVDRA